MNNESGNGNVSVRGSVSDRETEIEIGKGAEGRETHGGRKSWRRRPETRSVSKKRPAKKRLLTRNGKIFGILIF